MLTVPVLAWSVQLLLLMLLLFFRISCWRCRCCCRWRCHCCFPQLPPPSLRLLQLLVCC
jgi:hypothetical protein